MGADFVYNECGFYDGVVVDEVTPTYYAAAQPILEYEVRGHNFDLIPDDAFGVIAYRNTIPTEFVDNNFYHVPMVSKTNEVMVFRRTGAASFQQSYLGCVSKDGVDYYVNHTHPLP